jgi:hypothetical protein
MKAFASVLLTVACCHIAVCGGAGCNVGPTQATPQYHPVMTIKARAPQSVEVWTFAGSAGPADPSKARKFFANAPQFVSKALADELANAGYAVTRSNESSPSSTAAGVLVEGAVEQFFTDQTMSGYDTHVRVHLRVGGRGGGGGGAVLLEKDYEIQDGGSGITASTGEYEDMAGNALAKLMRKAIPDVVAAIGG